MRHQFFRSKFGFYKLPLFFPDATRAVVKTLDSKDIESTKTEGILVNTYHLLKEPGRRVIKKFGGIARFMNWKGPLISDSGGFQAMTLVKKMPGMGKVTDDGVIFKPIGGKKILLTPEVSIRFQMDLGVDMVVVLDDITPQNVSYEEARKTVERTIFWARRSKEEFLRYCESNKFTEENRPYLLGVVQGGDFPELRKECTQRLVEIGFDGIGYGGWPVGELGDFNYETGKIMAENTPSNYLLFGLGIGKPHEIVTLYDLGFRIFDCVLPTRDARHKRLYVYNANSIDEIDVRAKNFYSYYVPDKEKYYSDSKPVSYACDCLLCANYSRAYLAHLFRIKDVSALRLATIHNLRFYSILTEKLRENKT
ncbi:MAG: tRNA-guanine transglycosylase [Patescibacteria group bacterium]|nr:tRNA-guanine transglycosylase [Patescibacteria group bacterium]